jgi:acetyl-CoA C-acetyltransferase
MSLDPRTPVLVGVGQVTDRPGDPEPDHPKEPLGLMVAAVRLAVQDAGGAEAALFPTGTSIRVVRSLSWAVPDPGALVGEGVGIAPSESVVSSIGGNTPQSLVADSAAAIQRGELDTVVIVGGECGYARARARRNGERVAWTAQDESTPPARSFGTDKAPTTDTEAARGLLMPVQVYPILENALRMAARRTRSEHEARIGRLWSRFSEVAAENPYAWSPTARSADEVARPGPDNRMIAFPYPKLCTANIQVDQGAALLLTSVGVAEAAGVSRDRWVFPLAGAEANDHWYLSERAELSRSPAIRLSGRRALGLAGLGIDDVAVADLYSCFPCAVQIGAAELGLDLDGDVHRLTLTGGLTFGGGPGNNYASHGIASVVRALRAGAGDVGLATGLGWYATKHAVGVYSTRPPEHGFRTESVQAEVDALERWHEAPDATGPADVEAFTVVYDRDGRPERGIVSCRTGPSARTWANVTDADDALGELVSAEVASWSGTLRDGAVFELAG